MQLEKGRGLGAVALEEKAPDPPALSRHSITGCGWDRSRRFEQGRELNPRQLAGFDHDGCQNSLQTAAERPALRASRFSRCNKTAGPALMPDGDVGQDRRSSFIALSYSAGIFTSGALRSGDFLKIALNCFFCSGVRML